MAQTMQQVYLTLEDIVIKHESSNLVKASRQTDRIAKITLRLHPFNISKFTTIQLSTQRRIFKQNIRLQNVLCKE